MVSPITISNPHAAQNPQSTERDRNAADSNHVTETRDSARRLQVETQAVAQAQQQLQAGPQPDGIKLNPSSNAPVQERTPVPEPASAQQAPNQSGKSNRSIDIRA